MQIKLNSLFEIRSVETDGNSLMIELSEGVNNELIQKYHAGITESLNQLRLSEQQCEQIHDRLHTVFIRELFVTGLSTE